MIIDKKSYFPIAPWWKVCNSFITLIFIDCHDRLTPPVIVMDNASLSQARMKEEGWATGLLPVPVKNPSNGNVDKCLG